MTMPDWLYPSLITAIALKYGPEALKDFCLWQSYNITIDKMDYLAEFRGRFTKIPNSPNEYRALVDMLPYIEQVLA